MDARRSERLSQAMREELEEMISYEMGDPRIDVQGVSDVLVTPDGRKARVLLILTSNAKKQEDTIEALNHAKGFLRVELGHRLNIFRIPELHFEPAIGAELGSRVAHLLKRVRKGRPRPDEPPEKKPVE